MTTAASWRAASLGEICEFKYGRSLPEAQRMGGEVPVYGSNGLVGWHDAALTGGETIVIGRKGSFGEVNLSPVACWPIDTTYYVDRAATDADLKWLAYTLPALDLTELNRAAAVPGLNREDAYRKRLLVPPLSEQRRIAAILDQVDALRAKRRATITQLDTLAQSIFLDMFGDPVMNSCGWPRCALVELVDSPDDIKCGQFGTQLAAREFTSEGVPLWGIKHVNASFALPTHEYLAPATAERLGAYSIEPGDIVMTRKGTIGNCSIYPSSFSRGVMHSDLLRIRTSNHKCDAVFLAHQLRHSRDVERQLMQIGGGAVMPGINVTKLKKLEVVVPPLPVQKAFSERLVVLAGTKGQQDRSLCALDELFASLQHRAFRGEL